MKEFLLLVLMTLPAAANDAAPALKAYPVPMEAAVGSFEGDVSETWAKVRRLMRESRLKEYAWGISNAIARRNSKSAQAALDKMVRDFPDVAKEEPHAIEYHQGLIHFWKKDFDAAYLEFDKVLKGMEREYPNGIPPGAPYAAVNTSFMADAYFARGATAMQFGSFKRAVADIEKTISMSPRPKAYMYGNKCRALLPLKMYKEASEAYDSAYKINPKWVERAEDRTRTCDILLKNGLQPQACLPKK